MSSSSLRAVLSAAFIVSLAACGGSQPPIGAPGAVPQAITAQTRPHRASGSSGDLLYVTVARQVNVYSYDTQQFIETLSDFQSPQGMCADKKGDVYVTDGGQTTSQVLEYEHGARKPKRTIQTPSRPNDCAIDPVTGALGVTAQYGMVYVFKRGSSEPKTYSNPKIQEVLGCAYDARGNLFVIGFSYRRSSLTDYKLGELPRHSNRLGSVRRSHLPNEGYYAIQWDGSYIALYDIPYIYQLQIHHRRVIQKGRINLGEDSYQFAVIPKYGQMVATDDFGNANYYTYPGGKLITSLSVGPNAFGVAVSLAPSRSRIRH